jgi:hypothetical protein
VFTIEDRSPTTTTKKDSEMTAKELKGIFALAEYHRELEEMSGYFASIKQERPVIFSLAKFLWKRGRVFQLEAMTEPWKNF